MRVIFCLLFFLLPVCLLNAQEIPGLVAKYTFNNNNGKEELGKNNARIYNAMPVEDRFGNEGFACYLYGNISSFINLGTDTALKPRQGTLSLWAKITMVTYNGMGVPGNPILMTKSNAGEDFNEAYSIGYNFNTRHIAVANSLSERYQAYVHPNKTTALMVWHHIVMAYDDDYLTCYIDGVLEGKVHKGFRSEFLEGDSVLAGLCIDKKNLRFFCGCIDDIEIYNRVLSHQEIQQLYRQPNPNQNKAMLNWIMIALGAIAVVVLILWAIRKRVALALRRQNEKNHLLNKSYEQEMKVLKAQMNPHFIFNSLNTIQQFIVTNDNEKAQLYLSKFSRLMRQLLESNTHDSISLAQETDLLGRYLEIESLRFNNIFRYTISVAGTIGNQDIHIPHFLIQPFVENAIWHGLLPKEGDKTLSISFEAGEKNSIVCTVEDNGIGRQEKGGHTSREAQRPMAIEFIRQRLDLMSRIHNASYTLSIIDKKDEAGKNTGTKIVLTIPIIQ